jgi:hypothetical protein
MATRRIRISPAGNQFDVLGESPVWCPQDGSIYWIDWAMNVLRRMRSRDGALTEWKMKEKVGSFALRQSRGAILAMQSGFHLFDFESADTTFIANPNPAGIRHGLNDGKCDRAGRFWAGSIVAPLAELTSDSEPGFLFCLDGNLRSRKVFAICFANYALKWPGLSATCRKAQIPPRLPYWFVKVLRAPALDEKALSGAGSPSVQIWRAVSTHGPMKSTI